MIDALAAQLALRNRALGVTVASTTAAQTATTTGYHRAAGSYVTDGYKPGMEITSVTGFATSGNNLSSSTTGRVITRVTASDLTCSGTVDESAPVSATITVGYPSCRVWENIDTSPAPDRPYIEEAFVPATASMLSMPYQNGALEETGLYVLRVYGLANYGPEAIRKYVDALRALFTPGTTLTAGADTLRMRGDVSAAASQLLFEEDGWAVSVLTIPWRSTSTNQVAA